MIFSSQTFVKTSVSNAVKSVLMGGAFLVAMTGSAQAVDITPSLALGATGWSTDRYDPSSFANVGNFAGRNNVLGIGISTADGRAVRPSYFGESSFYNVQGKIQAITGGAGSTLAADLYIENSWSNSENGNVRTDLWGGTTDGTRSSTNMYDHRVGYPRIGFTNYGTGGARLRVSDDSVDGGWVNLNTTVNYGSWVGLSMTYTGSSIVYAVNGATVYTDNSIDDESTAPVGFSDVYLQAYNFNDTAANTLVPGAFGGNYTVHWINAMAQPVPEPETYALMLAGLIGVGVVARRRKQKNA